MLQPEMAQMEIWMELKKWRKWCLKVPWQPCWTLLHGQKGKQERERERESGIFWLLLPTLGEISWGSGGPPPPTNTPSTKGGRQRGLHQGRTSAWKAGCGPVRPLSGLTFTLSRTHPGSAKQSSSPRGCWISATAGNDPKGDFWLPRHLVYSAPWRK